MACDIYSFIHFKLVLNTSDKNVHLGLRVCVVTHNVHTFSVS